MSAKLVVSLAPLMALAFCGGALAQAPSSAEVSASGLSSIGKRAQVLRVQVELGADGRTAKEAIAKLNAKKDSARKKLLDLGAVEKSLQFTELRIGGDTRQQMEDMLRARIPRPGRASATQPSTVSFSAILKAEWPLSGGTPDELLLAAVELQEKIRAADPSGSQAAVPTEGDEEIREEMEMLMRGNEGQARSPVTFLFVVRITPEERAKALAEAFEKARSSAAGLAKAAGRELGPVQRLSSRSTIESPMAEYESYRYGPAYNRWARQAAEVDPDEAAGPQPTSVTLELAVTASFSLK